jgi:hypothetical protein
MWNWMMLGLESNRVIGLRIAKLMRGGKAAQREAQLMVSEKMLAAASGFACPAPPGDPVSMGTKSRESIYGYPGGGGAGEGSPQEADRLACKAWIKPPCWAFRDRRSHRPRSATR